MRLRLAVLIGAAALVPSAAAATPQVSARAWLVQNAATGDVLAAHAEDERVPIASITKLMTVVVALLKLDLDDVVVVDARAAGTEGATMNLRAGERIRVADLVEGTLIESANDAARALAFGAYGSEEEFVAKMNETARRFGLADTHFANPTGLDAPGHLSSARDVTKLARIAMQNPTIRSTVRLRATDAAGRYVDTWNDLLGRFPGLIGVKTGHTTAAGWSQVAAARGRGITIYATILGSPTRAQRNADLAELLAWGISRYRVVDAISATRTYAQAHTGYGRPAVRLVATKRLLRAVRVDRPLVERVVAPAVVALPVAKGQRLGEVRVYADRKLLGSRPLVAASSVSAPGFGGKVRWYATRTFENAWGLIG